MKPHELPRPVLEHYMERFKVRRPADLLGPCIESIRKTPENELVVRFPDGRRDQWTPNGRGWRLM